MTDWLWYIEGTNVLQTRFQTPSGSIVITDLMPVASEAEKRMLLLRDHEILPIVECERGTADIQMRLEPRIDGIEDGVVHARIELRAGQICHASLTFADDWPAVLPPLGECSRQAVARSVAWWSLPQRASLLFTLAGYF